jgi:hypothetical protein
MKKIVQLSPEMSDKKEAWNGHSRGMHPMIAQRTPLSISPQMPGTMMIPLSATGFFCWSEYFKRTELARIQLITQIRVATDENITSNTGYNQI